MHTILDTITDRILRQKGGEFAQFSAQHFPLARRAAPIPLNREADAPFLVIAEVKRASPSQGLLAPRVDPAALARIYQKNGAGAISVLTESFYFLGSPKDLSSVRSAVSLPLLRKDFLLHPMQVYESYNLGADMVLLIASCLDDMGMERMVQAARHLGLGILLEVHNPLEVARALGFEPDLIGINNRNLEDFSVDWNRSLELRRLIPRDQAVISESGIHSPEQIRSLKKAGFAGVLVGEHLMRSENPGRTLQELCHG